MLLDRAYPLVTKIRRGLGGCAPEQDLILLRKPKRGHRTCLQGTEATAHTAYLKGLSASLGAVQALGRAACYLDRDFSFALAYFCSRTRPEFLILLLGEA